jgi:acetylornithine deacetylase
MPGKQARVPQDSVGNTDFAAAAKQAKSLIRPLRDDIITLLEKLVRTRSVAIPPDGNELPAQKVLARAMRAARVDTDMYDTEFLKRVKHPYVRRDRNYINRPNVISRVFGAGGGRSLLLSGHMDTVPAPGDWADGPFSGRTKRGCLYGRGAWDMKGGLVAQFAVLMALRAGDVRLRGDVMAESVVDEEWAGGGGTLAGRLRGDKADACVIAEGTNLSIMRATRGGAFFEITARAGDPSKYFSKDEVVSPAMPMGRLLGWIEGWKDRRKQVDRGDVYAEFGDPAPVQVLALEGNRFDPDTTWSVPLVAKVRVYFQFLPHEDVAAIMGEVRRSLDEFAAADPFFSVYPPEWHDIVWPPLYGHALAFDHPWTDCLASSANAVLGREVPLSAAEYPCDAFLIQREFGIPTLLFGPMGAGAHNVNEFVKLSSVIETAETLLAAALVWCA